MVMLVWKCSYMEDANLELHGSLWEKEHKGDQFQYGFFR